MLGLPEVSRDSRWMTRMAERRARWCTDRRLSGRIPPGVIASGRHGQGAAHQPNGIATVLLLDRAVSHGDSLAKHAAARCKQSRAWVTRANSRLRRMSSSASMRWAARVMPRALACRCCARQRYNTFSGIPKSRATGRTDSCTTYSGPQFPDSRLRCSPAVQRSRS
jgi:hypothetical protein